MRKHIVILPKFVFLSIALCATAAGAITGAVKQAPSAQGYGAASTDGKALNSQLIQAVMGAWTGTGSRDDAVRRLLAVGADPNARAMSNALPAQGGKCPTVLMLASYWGEPDVVDVLIHAGANLEATDYDGSTVLFYAVAGRHSAVVARLIDAGAHVNVEDKNETPLILAAARGDNADIDILLSEGADVNARGTDDAWSFVLKGHLGMAQVIGDHVTIGGTALTAASGAGNASSVRSLIQAGADVNAAQTTSGQTALMKAASTGSPETVKTLLENDADFRRKDRHGETALWYAQNGNPPAYGVHVSTANRTAVIAALESAGARQ